MHRVSSMGTYTPKSHTHSALSLLLSILTLTKYFGSLELFPKENANNNTVSDAVKGPKKKQFPMC